MSRPGIEPVTISCLELDCVIKTWAITNFVKKVKHKISKRFCLDWRGNDSSIRKCIESVVEINSIPVLFRKICQHQIWSDKFCNTLELKERIWFRCLYIYIYMRCSMTKSTKWPIRQWSDRSLISLGIRPVSSESSLCTWWLAKDHKCVGVRMSKKIEYQITCVELVLTAMRKKKKDKRQRRVNQNDQTIEELLDSPVFRKFSNAVEQIFDSAEDINFGSLNPSEL